MVIDNYDAKIAQKIEKKWQNIWKKNNTFRADNKNGDLAGDYSNKKKFYILDMFPYPSGKGIHVGHPLGYIASDVFSRYYRQKGYNVLHPFGYDAFGLPAEQFAISTGVHPKDSTEENIKNMQSQMEKIGFDHDERRTIRTIDDNYVKWTQWIFLKIFNSYFDEESQKAKPINELIQKFEKDDEFNSKSESERRKIINSYRLAQITEKPVNWCPALGTVLANEEVNSEGKSERGGFPVFKKNLKQWELKITHYAKRLLDDLDDLDWPNKVKALQKNWIGMSDGATVKFKIGNKNVNVFTTRPDTLFGATFMVLSPEHPILENLPDKYDDNISEKWTAGFSSPKKAVENYKKTVAIAQSNTDDKTGIFTGLYAINPVNNEKIPVWTSDYVLMDYGEGAIMAVPSGDQRDFEFAKKFEIPIIQTVKTPDNFDTEQNAYEGDGEVINSATKNLSLNGLKVADAKKKMIKYLEDNKIGKKTTQYKLRDWLFSRQRYWGEPFPIVYDENNEPIGVDENSLPIKLPDTPDYQPKIYDANDSESNPVAPLDRNSDWTKVEIDGKKYRRDTNTMPQWAGSSWYYLRYIDSNNNSKIFDSENEKYWMGDSGVDLYIGGVEHAVLHLLYARFWHKVLYDLGIVSTKEPFHKLFNQGYIEAYAYKDENGFYVPASDVKEIAPKKFEYNGKPVIQEYGKMGKSLKNIVTPDDVIDEYGADTFRLYEMSMGPLDISRPWETRSIIGLFRFLQRLWRNIFDIEKNTVRQLQNEIPNDQLVYLNEAIYKTTSEMDNMRFNTAISHLIVLNNHMTKTVNSGQKLAEEVVKSLLIMLYPLAPHFAAECYEMLKFQGELPFISYPNYDEKYLKKDEVELVVQINGKIKAKLKISPDLDKEKIEQLVLNDSTVKKLLNGSEPKKVIVVPPKIVSIVV